MEGRGGTSDGGVMEYDLENTGGDPDFASGSTVFLAVSDWVDTFAGGFWFWGSSLGVLRPSGIM